MPLKPKSKKRGSKPASFDENFTGSEKDLSDIIRANAKYFNVKPPASDEETAQRIADMFQDCADTHSVPTVEKLALCLGVDRDTMFDWQKKENKGVQRAVIIKRAKEIIASIDAEAVVQGKLNTVAYIFRAQNYYGLSNDVKIEHKITPSLGDTQDQSMLVGALLKQLQGQGQATINLPQSEYQPQPSEIENAAENFLQATMDSTEPQAGATIAHSPAENLSDYPTAEEHQATMPEIVSEDPATFKSDYETELPSDYTEQVQATINPLSALGKALAEKTSSDYPEEASDYQNGLEIIDLPPDE